MFDFITPLASSINIKFSKLDDPSALNRFVEQANTKYFQCPSAAGTIVTAFPVGSGPPIETIGYNTSTGFLLTPGSPTPGDTGYSRISTGTGWPVLPGGYFPNIAKVGSSAKKIYAADGAKYTYTGQAQSYNITTFPVNSASTGNQSKYSDWGGWSNVLTGSYDQWHATTAGNVDGRIASFRHGATKGNRAGTFKLNAVFFDGHAETIDDIAATNPEYWLPRGTTFAADTSKLDAAVIARWGINATTYRVP